MARSALIVATDRYDDERLRALRAPAEDAAALARVLGDPEIGDFEVTYCTNPKEYELRRTVSAFFADRHPDDVLLLHFGCHGLKDDDGHLYFAAADTEFGHLDATAVPADFVNRRMNDSRSKRIVLFLDCCYSGAFAKGMSPRAGEQVEVKERFEGKGRVVLTASNSMEYSFEGEDRHGNGQRSVFTSALVHGLETGEADRDHDHWISVDELYDYVFDRVREQTPHQTPGKWSFVEGDVYLARSSYVPPVAPQELPSELLDLERHPVPSAREALVGELAELMTQPQYAAAARAALERLADDDSRRVFTAAQAALDDLSEAQPEPTAETEWAAIDEAREEMFPEIFAVAEPPETVAVAEPPEAIAVAPEPIAEAPPSPAVPARSPRDDAAASVVAILGVAALGSYLGGVFAGEAYVRGLFDSEAARDFLIGSVGALPVAAALLLARRAAWGTQAVIWFAVVVGGVLNLLLGAIDGPEAEAWVWAVGAALSAVASLTPSRSPRLVGIGTLVGAVAGAICFALFGGIDDGDAFVFISMGLTYAITGAAVAAPIVLIPRS
jgi:hypothetical protein